MSTTLNNQHILPHDNPDQLIAELHTWGIDYLVGGSYPVNAKVHLPAVELIKHLAECENVSTPECAMQASHSSCYRMKKSRRSVVR